MKSLVSELKSEILKEEFAEIRSRSTPAVCGAFEKQIKVKSAEVAKMKATLKKMGNFIVGQSPPSNSGMVTIWFNPVGVNL